MPQKYLELWLVRHGETDWNAGGRIQGNSDVPLNAVGERQARALHRRLSVLGDSFDMVHASDLTRAYRTASIALPQRTITSDGRLREVNFGEFEGVIGEELGQERRAQLRVWFRGPYHQAVPGGESRQMVRERARAWLSELPKTGKVIAFSHGGTISILIQSLLGDPSEQDWRDDKAWSVRLDNTSISKLWLSPTHSVLKTLNDSAHLEALSHSDYD